MGHQAVTDGAPVPIISKPGVKLDGASGEQQDFHTEAVWCRWHQGRARKIGGYRAIYNAVSEIPRGINSHPADNELFIHIGSGSFLTRLRVDVNTYNVAGVAARTPAGFATSTSNLWQFDQIYDASASFTAGTTRIIAHAAPNALDISSNTSVTAYSGDISATAALAAISGSEVSGGCVSFYPYTFVFGSDGYIRHSVANDPTNMTGTGSNQARVTAKKIVRGMAIRGGAGNAPSGLLWSLDSLVRVSFVGGSSVFSYDSMSSKSGILAAMSVVEHDSVYYWIGLGRFMMFNGVIRELPNNMNSNFFFENLNWKYRNRVFAFTVPRFGEIWWCFPKGTATECDHAIIYNILHNTWYDTPLPNTGRSAAENPDSFRFPLVGGIENASGYSLWQHEFGNDEIAGTPLQTRAIRSYYQTHEFTAAPQKNSTLAAGILEPDFEQTGDMTATMYGRSTTRANPQNLAERTFVAAPTDTTSEQFVNFKNAARYMRFRFESNVAGGFYQAGQPLLHISPTGGRMLG